MSLFDILFPDIATASHLRTIAETNNLQSTQLRIRQERSAVLSRAKTQSNLARIDELENEVGKAALVIEALIEIIEESGISSRQKIAERVHSIDGRDGVIDGKITPDEQPQLEAKHTTEEVRLKLHFPERE